MDNVGSGPSLTFDEFVEANRRLHLRRAPGRDSIPAEFLAPFWPVADIQMYPLCRRKIAGEGGHIERTSSGRIETSASPRPPEEMGAINELASTLHVQLSTTDTCGPRCPGVAVLRVVQFGMTAALLEHDALA